MTELGLTQTRRSENEKGRFTLVYLATEKGAPAVELTSGRGALPPREPWSSMPNTGEW